MIGFLLLTILVFYILFKPGLSDSDLCRNPTIDSIAYISDKEMYFFTSGGYFWIEKETDFPPKPSSGKPLPQGFKRGDAAIYKDTITACKGYKDPKPGEQEIYVLEKTENGNQIMVYDMTSMKWKEPIPYRLDRTISVAKIDWNRNVDAIFEYNRTQMYLVQGNKYSAIDFKIICSEPEDFAHLIAEEDTYPTIGTEYTIDAMTLVGDDKLLQFRGNNYHELKIDSMQSKDGKLVVLKSLPNSIATDFFKFKECPDQQSGGNQTSTAKGKSYSVIYMIIGVFICFIAFIVGVILLLSFHFGKDSDDDSGPKETDIVNKTATAAPDKSKTSTGQTKSPIKI